MGRKTIDITIDDEGRDKGKTYRITEMPAWQGEEWGIRVLLALTRAGAEVPDASLGMAGVKMAGLQALSGLQFHDLKPLMDEMMGCVVRVPNAQENPNVTRPLIESDTEEVVTRLRLRAEVFNLHTDFLKAGLLSTLLPQTPSPA